MLNIPQEIAPKFHFPRFAHFFLAMRCLFCHGKFVFTSNSQEFCIAKGSISRVDVQSSFLRAYGGLRGARQTVQRSINENSKPNLEMYGYIRHHLCPSHKYMSQNEYHT